MKNVLLDLRSFSFKRVYFLGIIGSTILILLSCFMLFFFAQHIMTDSLQNEIKKKTHVIGNIILSPIQIALEKGLDIHNLRGVENHFEDIIKDTPQLNYIWLSDDHKAVLYAHPMKKSSHAYVSDITIPIILKEKQIATLHLGIKTEIRNHSFLSPLHITGFMILLSIIIFEFFTAFFKYWFYSILFIIQKYMHSYKKGNFTSILEIKEKNEISRFIDCVNKLIVIINNTYSNLKSKINISSILTPYASALPKEMIERLEKCYDFSSPPQKKNLPNTTTLRFSLFLFIMSEAILIPLIPSYSIHLMEIDNSSFLYTSHIWIVLPILAFTLSYVFSQPILNFFYYFKRRNVHIFLIAGFLYAISLLISAFVSSFEEFIFWRLFSGFSFGLFIIISRIYLKNQEHTLLQNSSQNLVEITSFMSIFYGSLTCGTALGGLLKDTFDQRFPFFISLFIAFFCAIICHRYCKANENNFSHPHHQKEKFISKELSHPFLSLKNFVSTTSQFFRSHQKNDLFYFICFIAFPSRCLLSGVFLYAAPTYFITRNYSTFYIGQYLMLFSLINYVMNFFLPSLTFIHQRLLKNVLLGNTIINISCFVLLGTSYNDSYLLAFIVLFAIGFGLSLTSQFHVSHILNQPNSSANDSILNSFSFERFIGFIGFIIGPLLIAILQVYFTMITSVVILAFSNILLQIIYTLFFNKEENLIFFQYEENHLKNEHDK